MTTQSTHCTPSNAQQKPPRKSIITTTTTKRTSSIGKNLNARSKGSKNCPACFKKKIKCTHLKQLCAKIGDYKTPMNGYSNRLLYDSFKFHSKDRQKLDSIVLDQIDVFTQSISPQACMNQGVYRNELQKHFYEPIIKEFEKIAIEKVEMNSDNVSVSDESSSSNGQSCVSVDTIPPSQNYISNVECINIKQPPKVEAYQLVQPQLLKKNIKVKTDKWEKRCFLSLDDFLSVEHLTQAIERGCCFKPSKITFESSFSRTFTLVDGFILGLLRGIVSNPESVDLTLNCS